MDDNDKRTAVNANRRVANMTASQIESKRSIDRANQRYCRAKRKTQMDALQGQVEALTRELDEARRELRESRERERVLLGLGGISSEGDASSEALDVVGTFGDYVLSSDGGQGDGNALSHDLELHLTRSNTQTSSSLTAAFDQSGFEAFFPPPSTAFANVDPLLDPTWHLPSPSLSRPLPWTGHFTLDKFDSPFTNLAPAEWQSIPLLTSATTQLDQVILSTTETLRRGGFRAPQGNKSFPSISSLLNPASATESASSTSDGTCSISAAAAAQVGRSPVASALARVGFMYYLSHILRWYVCRTKETYDLLPPCIRPTLLQRQVVHPAWIDAILWPDIRDAIIQHMDWSRFYEFRAAISGSLCVGWPHRDMRNVFEPAADGKGFKLTDVFEQHLRNPDNWSVAATAAEAFPFLKPVTR
ncbi:hypothetical protein B0J13DRAFT_625809 [Dactylonectria estremocensis]|uniref:BZIP domain-containing protein n=1 Tax=Dactylonectria estremocensis TaxID=1079267 RepID=A0A9P9EA14_9HYPO|nr:hypothetical protein B0J13DRAFT_625809 [Dactylonectria estremocensis]